MRRFLFLLLASTPLVACAPDVSTPLSLPSDAAAIQLDVDADAQAFAVALAKALGSAEVRVHLRNAWRDSRVSTDHKLVSPDYFASPEGASVVAEMARRTDATPQSVIAMIQRLPALDVYLPIVEHRTTWKASDDILVAATFDQNAAQVTAYDVTGRARSVSGTDATKGPPLVIMHPAEPKFAAHGGQRYSTGDVIQLADAYPAAPGAEQFLPESGQTPIGVTASMMTTDIRLKYFDAFRDDGTFGGNLEMEFRSGGWEGYTLPVPYSTPTDYHCTWPTATADLPHQPAVYVNVLILANHSVMPAGCSETTFWYEGMVMCAVEMDGTGNPEDDFGCRWSRTGSMPWGYTVTTTSGGSSLWYYSNPGTTAGQKSIFMAMQIE